MTTVRFEVDGNVGIVTLCHPPLNLVTPEVVADSEKALVEARDSRIRAMVLRAEGDHFSGGADVQAMFQGLSIEEAHALMKRVTRLLSDAEQLPFPTLAVVQGTCVAAGLEIALGCDMIWVSEDAVLGLPEQTIGAIPFGGGAQRLAERAGSARAREMVMTGGFYDAAKCERWNIVNRVLPTDQLQEKSLRFARRLAEGPTQALVAGKRVVRAYLDEGMRAADDLIAEVAPPLFATDDMRHGIVSMLEKGPGQASFKGS